MPVVECDHCGEKLDRIPSQVNDHNFCDRSCYGSWRSESAADPSNSYTYECEVCGDEKTIPMAWKRKKDSNPKYCSRECKHKAGRKTKICSNPDCDVEFTTPNWRDKEFCSTDCAYGNRSVDGVTRVELVCDYCDGVFEARPDQEDRRRFCSFACKGKWQEENLSGEDHPAWKGGRPDYYGTDWQKNRRAVLERDEYSCVICGDGEDELGRKPDVHHIKPVMEFKESNDAHDPSNLVTLCRKHHSIVEGWNLIPPGIHPNN